MPNKQAELHLWLYRLSRQYPQTELVCTCNHCATKGCEGVVVGAGICADCIESKIAEITNHTLAMAAHKSTKEYSDLVKKMDMMARAN